MKPDLERIKPSHNYTTVIAVFGLYLTFLGTHHTYGVFFKPILGEFGWTRAITAGARSLNSGIVGVMGIFTGWLTDRFGARVVILFLGSSLGIGYLLMSKVGSLGQFYLVYGVVLGIGLGAAVVPLNTVAVRLSVKHRGFFTGIAQAGGGIGAMILVPVAGWLALNYGWRSAYFILGIIALVLIIAMGSFLKTDSGQSKQPRHYDIDAGLHDMKDDGQRLAAPGFSLSQATLTKQFWVLMVMLFTIGFCRSIMLVHIAAHVTDLGFSLAAGASILAIMSGVGMASRIGMGRLSDMIGYKRALFIGFVVMTGSVLWALIAHEMWMLYLLAISFGFSWGALAVLRMTVIAEVFGAGSLGVILGAIEFGAQSGAIIGPFFAGWAFDVNGEYTLAFITMAVASFLSSILLIFLKPKEIKR